MKALTLVLGLSLGIASTAGAQTAMEGGGEFAPPGSGPARCVAINEYRVRPLEAGQYQASATLENVCPRSVQVQFCFLYLEPVDGLDRGCFDGFIRPWASTSIEDFRTGMRIVGTDFRVRYLPHRPGP